MLNGKPLICVSSDIRTYEDDKRRMIHELHDTYSNAVFNAGGIPMITCGLCAEEMADLCDGLLLTGGADMDTELYGEEPLNDSVKPLPERTAFEKPLFEAFLKRGKPILGICRGSLQSLPSNTSSFLFGSEFLLGFQFFHGQLAEAVLAGDKAQRPAVIPIHLDIAKTVYTLDGTAGSGRDRVRIFTHRDKLQSGARWIVQAGHCRPSLFFSCHTFPPF